MKKEIKKCKHCNAILFLGWGSKLDLESPIKYDRDTCQTCEIKEYAEKIKNK